MAYLRWVESNWYIFYIAGMPPGRNKQKIATYLAGDWFGDGGGPDSMSYPEVVNFLKSPNWDLWSLPLEDRDKEDFVYAAKLFVSDVEKDYP